MFNIVQELLVLTNWFCRGNINTSGENRGFDTSLCVFLFLFLFSFLTPLDCNFHVVLWYFEGRSGIPLVLNCSELSKSSLLAELGSAPDYRRESPWPAWPVGYFTKVELGKSRRGSARSAQRIQTCLRPTKAEPGWAGATVADRGKVVQKLARPRRFGSIADSLMLSWRGRVRHAPHQASHFNLTQNPRSSDQVCSAQMFREKPSMTYTFTGKCGYSC